MCDSRVDARLQHGFGWPVGRAFGDADAVLLQLQQLDALGGLPGAEDQAQGWLLAGLAFVAVQPAEVEGGPDEVGRLESLMADGA